MVGCGRIESPVPANPDNGLAVSQDDVRSFRTGPWRFLDGRRFVGRYAVDLRGMENRIVFQNADCFPAVVGFVVIDLIRLAEKDSRGFLALANLPFLFVRLLVRSSSADRRSEKLACPCRE